MRLVSREGRTAEQWKALQDVESTLTAERSAREQLQRSREQLARRLLAARQAGISAKDLASMVGCTRARIYQLVNQAALDDGI